MEGRRRAMSGSGNGRRHRSSRLLVSEVPKLEVEHESRLLEDELEQIWQSLQGESAEYLRDLEAIQEKYRESLKDIADDPITKEYRRQRDRALESAP